MMRTWEQEGVIVHACDENCPIQWSSHCLRERGHESPHRVEFRRIKVRGADRLTIEWWPEDGASVSVETTAG